MYHIAYHDLIHVSPTFNVLVALPLPLCISYIEPTLHSWKLHTFGSCGPIVYSICYGYHRISNIEYHQYLTYINVLLTFTPLGHTAFIPQHCLDLAHLHR